MCFLVLIVDLVLPLVLSRIFIFSFTSIQKHIWIWIGFPKMRWLLKWTCVLCKSFHMQSSPRRSRCAAKWNKNLRWLSETCMEKTFFVFLIDYWYIDNFLIIFMWKWYGSAAFTRHPLVSFWCLRAYKWHTGT